jgi:16S rRNA G966 N2-methylase RsmD
MECCCSPAGYEEEFGSGYASRLTKQYRRRGLDRTARRMVAWIAAQGGLEAASVLEIGGGVGALHLELLRRGAASATCLELVSAYDGDAARLAADLGLAERVTRRRIVLAAAPGAVDRHDIVVLHRVVCCYPDAERLLTAAAGRADRLLVFSYPPDSALSRGLGAVENLLLRLRGRAFRTFVHRPDAMRAAAERAGFAARHQRDGLVWGVMAMTAAAE